MNLFKKFTAVFLAMLLLMTGQASLITTIAAATAASGVTVLQNSFIKITVDNATGRFGIRTVDGQPTRKNDQHVNMLFRGDDPETSFTTFRLNGTDYIFGNPYQFGAGFFSEITKPTIVVNTNGTRQIETVWRMNGVQIKQILMLYMDAKDFKQAGNVNIRYEVVNQNKVDVEIGSRILLDTMVAGKDGPEFQIGSIYRSPLTVERKLVHDPAAIGVPAEDVAYYKLPPYWVMRDNLDLTNPLATNVMAYGFNNIAENQVHIVDEMIVGHWNGLANTKWDYEVNPNLDFTKDTNDYGTADSAVALYWLPDRLGAQQATSFETIYGLGEVIQPDQVFSIRYLDAVQQLAMLPDNSGYENEGIFDIHAEIENLPAFQMEHSEIRLHMTLEGGLSFVKLDDAGNIVRDENGAAITETVRSKELIYRKPATPQEAELGIKPAYQPGDTITTSYKVKAEGRAWPTTRQYLLTARSPQTQAKLQSLPSSVDEGVLAEYESTKANFVLLPAIGEAVKTYSYAVSPKEVFSSDVKYVTINLTNIEAYNTGDEHTPANFDLYFQETVTGKRYKVPVQKSVILQPTDSGLAGDMRITYRNGDLVNKAGDVLKPNVGADLPLGEYQVEIDFKGEMGGDTELAGRFDLITPQTFLVTNNDVARIREAGILAVYKQTFDLGNVPLNASDEYLEEINELIPHNPFTPGASLGQAKNDLLQARAQFVVKSRIVDADFDVDDLLDPDTLTGLPLYGYQMFADEQERAAFFDNRDDREELAVIKGMVKEVGVGADRTVVVDTSTEPALINDSVAYKGKDLVFVRGHMQVFGKSYASNPLLDTLFVKGDGVLSVSNSGFVFHRGEWTLDFFNSFDKSLDAEVNTPDEDEDEDEDNPEDDSLNGSLKWAMGEMTSRLNPLRQIMIPQVYFNAHTIFSIPSFIIGGFGFQFYETTLRPGGVSFGGYISFQIVSGEIKNVVFNDKGFVGVDAALKFALEEDLGVFKPGVGDVNGELSVVHYVQKVEGIDNEYRIAFDADLENIAVVGIELSFKQVDDGRVLPDTIGFSADLPRPGVLITGGTYLEAIRGAIRELADTIAGGTSDDPMPLTLEAGASIRFGIAPAYHFGDIDLTLKRTGIKIEGVLSFSTKEDPADDDLIPMITRALLEAQWVTPWFVRVAADVDVMGWDIIIGKAAFFVGQNLEKNRADFEGFISAKVQIPKNVPVVGGMPLSSVFLGANNDKVWGKVGILLISLGITYYWGGGIAFGTSGDQLPDGLIHMIIEDPEDGPRLFVIGQGVQTVATSWIQSESEEQGVIYRSIAEGVQVIEQNTMNVGIGGILVTNGGRKHVIPMDAVNGNALIEIRYEDKEMPELTLRNASGEVYPVIYDNTNTNPEANAFTQFIPAAQSSDQTDSRKAYIIVPQDQLQTGGTWTLTSTKAVETKLLNVPMTPTLSQVTLMNHESDANKFTSSWEVAHAQPGDTISLFLTKDALVEASTMGPDEENLQQPEDAGLLLAKDLPVARGGTTIGNVTRGSFELDVTQIQLLGDTEDIRGLLRQGHYYLRAELKSAVGYGTMTSQEQFALVDPLAPNSVSDVSVTPAGNGKFALSFQPAATKSGHESFEHSYIIEALTGAGGNLATYQPFAEQLMTAEELKKHVNPQNGRYEGILIGGWSRMSLSEEDRYVGLETGQKYVIRVTAVTKPSIEADKHRNLHYSEGMDTVSTLLPTPTYPKLRAASDTGFGSKINVHTNQTRQTLSLVADQKDIEVEAIYNGKSLGITQLKNQGNQSVGEIIFDTFDTDGTYGIELKARNRVTKDFKQTLLYLTVDTIAPILYLEQPKTGDRTVNGKIHVQGMTTNDANLTINGARIPIDRSGNGHFSADIPVNTDEPTVMLNLVARDDAGNENRAMVEVTNDGYQAPAALVLRPMKLTMGESRQLEALLKLPDGVTDQGEAKYRLVPIPDKEYEKMLSFHVYSGDAASVSDNGQLAAKQVGASLIRTTYRVSDEVSLQADLSVMVDHPQAVGLTDLNVYTAPVAMQSNRTQVSVTNADDLIGYQLVYKIIEAGAAGVKPVYREDLQEWTLLPANGIIPITSNEKLIVAKRTSLTKEAVASTGIMIPNVYASGGGGGGGGIPGGGVPGGGVIVPPSNTDNSQTQELQLNGSPLQSVWEKDRLITTLTAEDLSDVDSKEFILSSKDTSNMNRRIRIDPQAREQLARGNKPIIIDLPDMKLTIQPDQLQQIKGSFEIDIVPNDETSRQTGARAMGLLNAKLLGNGQGVTIRTNLPGSLATRGIDAAAMIAIPDNIRLQQITAVVLQGPNGEWTPIPWKLDMQSGKAYASVHLTGEGSLFFVQQQTEFTDVSANFWGRSEIAEAGARLLVSGGGDGRFAPNSAVTRAEFPTILLRAGGYLNHQQASSSFSDVNRNDWYYNSVGQAALLGIVEGMNNSQFAPARSVSRIEGMTMVGRLLVARGIVNELSDAEVERILSPFEDHASVPSWGRQAAALSIRAGIILGANNRVDSDGVLTRAQAAVIALRIDQLLSGRK